MATCIITGTITNLDGTPNTDVGIKAEVDSTFDDLGGQLVAGQGVTGQIVEAFTDDNGVFAITLLQGARVLLQIPEIRLRKFIIVPTAGTADFATLI